MYAWHPLSFSLPHGMTLTILYLKSYYYSTRTVPILLKISQFPIELLELQCHTAIYGVAQLSLCTTLNQMRVNKETTLRVRPSLPLSNI